MTTLDFITETEARKLIESEVEENRGKGFIITSGGFVQHLIDTGRIGYETANTILLKHPSLRGQVNPDLIRASGYMHDFSKIHEGSRYHEVGAAYLILTQGDTNLGLVRGGTESERKKVLKE